MMVLAGALMLPLTALAGNSPAGQWTGEVETPEGDKVDIRLSLAQQGSAWQGTLEDPTMGETIVSNLRVTGTRISFTFKPANAPFPLNFSGSYVAADDRVTGTFSLHGNSRFVKFQRVPGSETVVLAAGAEAKEPARIRHDYKFAATGRLSYWAGLHLTKDNVYTLNDMTVGTLNYDASVRWFVMDGFNVFFRYFRGGHDFTDNQARLDQFPDLNVSSASHLKLDGMEIGIMGYLGNIIVPDSKFNPYLTATGGQVKWALYENGRGSAVMQEGQHPFEGDDLVFSFGAGTEYEISRKLSLEFEWLWRYFMTEDEKKWPNTDGMWSNTHAWGLSAGVTYGF
jgi:opacity protein-like surface antigen